jgi:hypothetical protein
MGWLRSPHFLLEAANGCDMFHRLHREAAAPRASVGKRKTNYMANSNCLAGIACPKCNSENRFGIGVSAFAYLQDDGCESTQDIEWDDQSSIVCCACDHSGTVKEFTIQ